MQLTPVIAEYLLKSTTDKDGEFKSECDHFKTLLENQIKEQGFDLAKFRQEMKPLEGCRVCTYVDVVNRLSELWLGCRSVVHTDSKGKRYQACSVHCNVAAKEGPAQLLHNITQSELSKFMAELDAKLRAALINIRYPTCVVSVKCIKLRQVLRLHASILLVDWMKSILFEIEWYVTRMWPYH